MGEQKVSLLKGARKLQRFTRNLINDVEALDQMIQNNMFEDDIVRIGAEQEMCIVDKTTFKPLPRNLDILNMLGDVDFAETELAKFNLEINLSPLEFTGDCFSKMEAETRERILYIQKYADKIDAQIILTGILPTLRKHHLEMSNLTPLKRYKALMDAINAQLLKDAYELKLTGIDELNIKHNSPMLEACNTSFQVHLQVNPSNFVQLYNIAQVITAPVMAVSANSPIVFGKRLWHESRIALFQQSLDTRSSNEHLRERSARVYFGNDWIRESILDIYKEDISRFRVLISGDQEEDALQMLKDGKIPKLRALQVHNSTVYRWNRPCYGISPNGKPHLRIENRVLPAGPTIIDEIANSALWLGSIIDYAENFEDITQFITFPEARDNFIKAARYGIDTKFTWLNDQKISAVDLVREEVIPRAKNGLRKMKVKEEDIDRYLGIIEKRMEKHTTGARWMLRAYNDLIEKIPRDEAVSVLTSSIIRNQSQSLPVHEWSSPDARDLKIYKPSRIKVDEFMTTDLFTVQKDDPVDLVAEMMNWRKIRYLPVENSKGELEGLITLRIILRHFLKMRKLKSNRSATVAELMLTDLSTVKPSDSIFHAMRLMNENKFGCLPVVDEKELVGILTEQDFLRISGRLIERLEDDD
ncbi:MAG: CBS domain-containing protein [Saprospirales bacterium]|nr:MAG: CBS domain-containing protein [Saprospirales bacterium]